MNITPIMQARRKSSECRKSLDIREKKNPSDHNEIARVNQEKVRQTKDFLFFICKNTNKHRVVIKLKNSEKE